MQNTDGVWVELVSYATALHLCAKKLNSGLRVAEPGRHSS